MSGSTLDNLIVMANQIGDFFETMRDRKQSMDEIAGHLRRAWAPRMRIALMEHVEQHGGEGLHPIVLEAVRTHKMI
jgi:formate dehydrogenase subunit delta